MAAMGVHHGLFDGLIVFLGYVLLGHAQYVEMDWATDTYGPDGPWNAYDRLWFNWK